MRVLYGEGGGMGIFDGVVDSVFEESIGVDERKLWSAFSGGGLVGCVEIKGFGGWSYCLLEDYAWGSQWDRLERMDVGLGYLPLMSVARSGRGFHGKGDRVWVSPEGNLYFCGMLFVGEGGYWEEKVLSLGDDISREISLMIAGCFEGLELGGVNDILYSGRKIGGVLTGLRKVNGGWILSVGLGLNVGVSPDLGVGVSRESGCLREIGGYEGIGLGEVLLRVSDGLFRGVVGE